MSGEKPRSMVISLAAADRSPLLLEDAQRHHLCRVTRFARVLIWTISIYLIPQLAAAANKSADGWAVESAPYRVALHAADKPGAPDAGWEIRLPDFGAGRPDLRDVMLLGSDGKEIGLDSVWRGSGRALLALAEAMPGDGAAAYLYFGGDNSRRMRFWSAKRSLLLETRRLPAGAKVTTFAGWQEAWNKSPAVDGAAFVPMVFHGDNPFGASNDFMSRYTGRLITGDGGAMKFYTLSDDVSYVMIDNRPALKWQRDQPPPLRPDKVPMVEVHLPKEFASVDYCHAVGAGPAAMVLGWDRGGKPGNVPPEAWVHPGKVTSGAIESRDHAPVPLATVAAGSYIGYGNEWYVSVKCSIPDPGDGWQVEWLWPDGRIDQGVETRRLWMSLEPVKVVVRLRNGARLIEGRQVYAVPQDLAAASVNHAGQMKEFLYLLDREDPSALAEAARRSGFVLASAFLPSAAAARWAEAWLVLAKPAPGAWVGAMALAIRELGQNDPKAALARLSGLAAPERALMGREADLLELDLRVFGLKDPLVVALVDRLRKGGDVPLARMAIIRLGDYHLLNGRIDDAARCFTEAVTHAKDAEQKGPVIDRSHSLAIEDLVKARHLDEARAMLDAWERQHPMAKIVGDQLLWRARVNFLAGDWQRTLQDLETSLKVRPGSPEEIEVLFWQGRALFELGRKAEARKIWTALVKEYPKHERAEAAKQWANKP